MLLLALLATAQAVPIQLTQQGRLLDPSGAAVTGLHDLHFRIYDEATAGDLLWEDEIQVDFANGYYAAILGADEAANPLDGDTLSLFPLYLELELDSNGPMSPRQALTSAPYAQLAGTAKNLEGGTVDATSVSIGGLQVIDATGSWTGTISVDWNTQLANIPGDILDGDDNTQLSDADVRAHVEAAAVDLHASSTVGGLAILTADSDNLGGLSCTSGELAGWDGADWVCVSDNTLDAQDVVDAVTAAAVDLHADSTVGGLAILTEVDDQDSLAELGLSCIDDGDVAIWDAGAQEWYCGAQTDTVLGSSDVEGYVTDDAIGLAAGSTVGGQNIVGEPEGGCSDGQALAYSEEEGGWTCTAMADTLSGLGCSSGQIIAYGEAGWACTDLADALDGDGDGVVSWNDCNDTDPGLLSRNQDADCDGHVNAALGGSDCNDEDSESTTTLTDADCDGAETQSEGGTDCDDEDPESTTTLTDADCDTVLDDDDCNDEDPNTPNDMDCDGVATGDDCDDSDSSLTHYDGLTESCPAESCLAILDAGLSAGDGSYYLGTVDSPVLFTCDMSGGGWTVIENEDYAVAPTEWSDNSLYNCGSFGSVLGNFGGGESVERTFDLPAHTEYSVSLYFIKIDSWDGEYGYAYVDGEQIWSQIGYNGTGSQVCGSGESTHKDARWSISETADHAEPTITFRFTAGLNSGAYDESWGIDDFLLKVR